MADGNPIPKMIGRYEIRGEIGRGGMATVYRAYDPRSKREVAVKVLPRELLHNPQFHTRFALEAEVIASLEHPAIVPVYDFGEDVANNQPYFVMRLMTGGSLEERLARGPLSTSECARLISRIAPALDRAHHKGIVHRDLKPGNILFDDDNNPYISDFGIVKLTQSGVSLTGSGVVGTPAYMSPEQAMGEEQIDGRSDVYSLGAILFQMLTANFPFRATTPMGVVVKHITEPVPLIRDVKPDLPIEIEDIIQRALAKKREERFQTATELAHALAVVGGNVATLADITQPLGKPTLTPTLGPGSDLTVVAPAKTVPKTGSSVRWLVGLLAVTVVIAAIAITAISINNNTLAQQTASAAAMAFVTNTAQAEQTGTAIAQINATAAALDTATASVLANPTDTATLTETSTSTAAATRTLTPTDTPTLTLTPTPAPTQFGGGTGLIVFVSKRDGNNEIYVVNSDGSNPLRLTNDSANDAFPIFSPDGMQIAFYTNRNGDNEIYVMNADGSELTRLTNNAANDYSPAWSPDGAQIVFVSNRDGNNQLYVMGANGSVPALLTDNRAGHESPSWSQDGRIAFSTNRDGNYEIYSINADGSDPVRLTDHRADDTYPVWSPDGAKIAFSSNRDGNFEIYIMNVDGSNVLRLTDNSADDTSPAWSPDGTHLTFTSVRDGNQEIYLINADGSGTTRLTYDPSVDFAAAWQP